MYRVLTIAGSDSCAGAGIQADLKTIAALGGYGLSVITAVTAQNTLGVTAIQEIEADVILAQLKAVFSDINIQAVKIGMLFSTATVALVADFLQNIPPDKRPLTVLDPVMAAKSGHKLLKAEATEAMLELLLPHVHIITPNLGEAAMILGQKVSNIAEMERAAKDILELGPAWAVVKGGHLSGDACDVIANGDKIYHLTTSRISGNNNHGTGCTFSAAIASYLALGEPELEAVAKAKDYVTAALEKGFPIGAGVGVLDHFYLKH